MWNSSGDTYSPCLGWQLSVYHLHPVSQLLSFSFKCRWHSCPPFYQFICWCFFFSFFILNTHFASILSSVFVFVSFSWPLSPPYLIFVSFLLVSYRGKFGDIYNHYSGLSIWDIELQNLRLYGYYVFVLCCSVMSMLQGNWLANKTSLFPSDGSYAASPQGVCSSKVMAPSLSVLLN